MKYAYNLTVVKSDGTSANFGVVAQDTTSPAKSAAENATAYGVSQGGAGSYVQSCFMACKIDHDTTV